MPCHYLNVSNTAIESSYLDLHKTAFAGRVHSVMTVRNESAEIWALFSPELSGSVSLTAFHPVVSTEVATIGQDIKELEIFLIS